MLAQQLYCIETLARVDVLCLDKTGTITSGHMEVEGCLLYTSTTGILGGSGAAKSALSSIGGAAPSHSSGNCSWHSRCC